MTAAPALPELLLVRPLLGRSGSSAVMELLGTAPEIAMERTFPYERNHVAYLLRVAQGLYPEPASGLPARLAAAAGRRWHRWRGGATPPPPPTDTDLFDVRVARYHAGTALWAATARAIVEAAAAEGRPPPRYVAEKATYVRPDFLPGARLRVVHLVRDPRDLWASVNAFDERRGYYGFGRRRGETREDYLRSFLSTLARRAGELAEEAAAWSPFVVRYEDLVTEPGPVATALSGWLGVRLDPAQVRVHAGHVTSAATGSSVGRWRSELPAHEVATIEDELGEQLVRLGYPLEARAPEG